MASTKYILAEQVSYRLYGGMPDTASPVQFEDIYKAIEQKLNAQYAFQQYSINLPNAGTIPNNLCLATYDDIAIESNGIANESRSKLPIMPISLPRNAGINEIRPVIKSNSQQKILGKPMIPLQAGQSYLLEADKLLNSLFGEISYEPNGAYVKYNMDLTSLEITKVQMKLVVFDMSQYSETDPLPIPASDEELLVNELVKQFSPVMPESGLVNNFTTPTNKQ